MTNEQYQSEIVSIATDAVKAYDRQLGYSCAEYRVTVHLSSSCVLPDRINKVGIPCAVSGRGIGMPGRGSVEIRVENK